MEELKVSLPSANKRSRTFKTRTVMVGDIGVGGSNPIRIQSMTTSDTSDVLATVDQIARLSDVGCDIARVTVQGVKEAKACFAIKEELLKRGLTIPLVADIHFFPKAALEVVEAVDKVRINPGNFVDKRASFKTIEYDDATYALELERLEEVFSPLVEKCKRLKRALRIGTNHGSLSDRIMNRYGDSPLGMVESAIEFTHVCRKYNFHDLIFSMKASNPKVMIESYRLLVARMQHLGWDYPLHLGVTEAGAHEEGRVKSAIGIGALLTEGLGDTIRVSLTEEPWKEIDPCQRLIAFAASREPNPIAAPFIKRRIHVIEGLHRDGSFILKNDPLLAQGAFVSENANLDALLAFPPSLIFFNPTSDYVAQTRSFHSWIIKYLPNTPLILCFDYTCSKEDLIITAAAEMGSLLVDGIGEGIYIRGDYPLVFLQSLSLSILQGTRLRLSKTEFISCPGCGRTLFDLQEVSARIRAKTAHLPGVKIAIMGCIVNGPGEMADADFGYVGSKPDMIDLYVGKTRVEKDIPMQEADARLIALIKAHGRWKQSGAKI